LEQRCERAAAKARWGDEAVLRMLRYFLGHGTVYASALARV
jgi:hypothetical protein